MPEQSVADERRRRRVERMLYDWAEADPNQRLHEPGYPSTSPTYRMMREGMPGQGRSKTTGRWRQRQRRSNRGETLTLAPAETCHGRETHSMQRPRRTLAEGLVHDADRAGSPRTIDRLLRHMPADMQAIIYAKFVDKQARMQDIAEHLNRPGLDRKSCSVLYRNALEMIAIQTIDVPAAAARPAIPDPLPIM